MRIHTVEMRQMEDHSVKNWSRALRPTLFRWTFHGVKKLDLPLEKTESISLFEDWLYEKVGDIVVQIRLPTRTRTKNGKMIPISRKIAQIDFRKYKETGNALWKYDSIKKHDWFRASQPQIIERGAKLLTRD